MCVESLNAVQALLCYSRMLWCYRRCFSHKSKAQHHKAAVKKINSILSRASAMLQMMLQCYMHIHKHISFHFFYVDQHGEES